MTHDTNNTPLDAEAKLVAVALDALAQRERSEPDAGFEARLHAATAPMLRSGHERLRLVHGGATPRIAGRRPWIFRPTALAAGLALVLTAAASFLASRPSAPMAASPTTTLASLVSEGVDEQLWLALDSGEATEMDSLFKELAALDTNIPARLDGTGDSWTTDLLDGSSM